MTGQLSSELTGQVTGQLIRQVSGQLTSQLIGWLTMYLQPSKKIETTDNASISCKKNYWFSVRGLEDQESEQTIMRISERARRRRV